MEFHTAPELIRRALNILEVWLKLDSELQGEVYLKKRGEKSLPVETYLDADTIQYIQNKLDELHPEVLKIIPGAGVAEPKGYEKLQKMAVGEEELGREISRPAIKKIFRYPGELVDDVLKDTVRSAASEIEKSIKPEDLETLEKELKRLKWLMEVAKFLTYLEGQELTAKQRGKATDCRTALRRFVKKPETGTDYDLNVAYKDLTGTDYDLNVAYKDLISSVKTVEQVIKDAGQKAKELRSTLERTMKYRQEEIDGIKKILETLSPEVRADYKILEKLMAEVDNKLGEVKEAYKNFVEKITLLLKLLSKDGADCGTAVQAIEDKNFEDLYASVFNKSMAELAEAMSRFDQQLKRGALPDKVFGTLDDR